MLVPARFQQNAVDLEKRSERNEHTHTRARAWQLIDFNFLSAFMVENGWYSLRMHVNATLLRERDKFSENEVSNEVRSTVTVAHRHSV